MNNRYFKGEKLVIAGNLTEDNKTVTDYDLYLYIYKSGRLIGQLLFVKSNELYSVELDTNTYFGSLILRFVMRNKVDNSEIVVGNNDIPITINEI